MRTATWTILTLGLVAWPGQSRSEEYNPFEKGQDDLAQVEKELLEDRLSYGFEKAPVQLHAFINSALWWLGKDALGSYANVGSDMAGHPLFVTYSGYINVSANLSETVFAEAEFELYKGEKGEFKVTKLRGVWTPNKYFKLALGRDFPPIGVQDKVYYPPSQYRLIPIAPYAYWSILRATGWWDAGVHLSGKLPLSFLGSKDGYVRLDASVINGPGDLHQDQDNYLLNAMKPNAEGYMFEGFHAKARQPWDNNSSKFFPVRLTISPLKNLEFGASFMEGFYDDDNEYFARYVFAHLLYGGSRLTVAAEYTLLQVEVDPLSFRTDLNRSNGTYDNDVVSQHSAYISAGYKIIKDQLGIHFFELVFRVEYMDSWIEDKTNKSDRILAWAGLRFSPVQYWQIKLAGALQWEPGGPDLKNNMLVAETVFEF